jgi:hypothetical protein
MLYSPKIAKCVFCDDRMTYVSESHQLTHLYYSCHNDSCLVNHDFSRYKIEIDTDEKLINQEYAIDKFYVRVYSEHNDSLIYRMQSCMLEDEIKIPRALWLNSTNIVQTLTTIKTLIMFS